MTYGRNSTEAAIRPRPASAMFGLDKPPFIDSAIHSADSMCDFTWD